MRITTILAGATLGAGALLLGACEGTYVGYSDSAYPNYAVTGTPAYYDYTYYPDSEVYYYAPQRTYYWRDRDAWHHGREVPRSYSIDRNRSVVIRSQSNHPWERHDYYRSQYPRNGNWNRSDRDHDRDRH